MDREETLKAIEVMKAYAEGKKIEVSLSDRKSFEFSSSPLWNWESFLYRIKPEPKLRPFTQEEFLKSVTEKSPMLKIKGGSAYQSVTEIHRVCVHISGADINYSTLLDKYEFQDGTPCGVEE